MPAPAELLRDFVNTYDVEQGTDDLATEAQLAAWLREHGLLEDGLAEDGGPRPGDPVDLEVVRRLREGLRLALRHNHDAVPYAMPEELDAALAALPLRVTLVGGLPELRPTTTGLAAGLGRIAAQIPAAYADGTWQRIKVCAESTCQWAFIDSSKNRSRAWCSMKVCGNRTKTRAYRARQRGEGSPSPS